MKFIKNEFINDKYVNSFKGFEVNKEDHSESLQMEELQ